MRKTAPVILTLILGGLLSIGASLVVWSWETEQTQERFARAVFQREVNLRQRLSSALDAVESIGAFYAGSDEITRAEFKRFAERELEGRSAIRALEWIPRVKAADRAAFEAAAREDGHKWFSFTEHQSLVRMAPAGDRDEYFPVYFVEPYRGNEIVLGFDLGSTPARMAALEQARDHGQLQATKRIILLQETAKSFGFLVYQPVYRNGTKTKTVEDRRKNLRGFALGVLRVDDLAQMPALGAESYHENMKIFIFDQSAPADQQLLYPATAPFKTLAEVDSGYCVNSPETVGGRNWVVVHCSTSSGPPPSERWQSLFVLTLGFLVTGVTAVFLRSQSNQKARAANMAADLAQLIDTANTPIFGVNKQGRINEWNQAAAHLTGYGRNEVLDCSTIDEFIPEEFKKQARKIMDSTLEGQETENYEMPILTRKGEIVTVLLNLSSRRDAAGNIVGVIGIGQDITGRKEAEAQVIQASKLATLGEMTTAVSHELNQPLNVIRMAAGNVLRKLDKGEAEPGYLRDKLERIAGQTERAAAIIDHMRIFGRKAEENPIGLDPRDAVRGALDLMGEQLRLAEIEVVTDLPETCRPVLGHRVPLEQVILNLMINARDAIQGKASSGEKTIRMGLEDRGAETVRIFVADTGGGIPEENLTRIFEPFFTTKALGEGTGLGLSVSYGIIRDMGGTIEAENIEVGARLTITLPVAAEIAHGGSEGMSSSPRLSVA